jgi:hypothetical protein
MRRGESEGSRRDQEQLVLVVTGVVPSLLRVLERNRERKRGEGPRNEHEAVMRRSEREKYLNSLS